MKNLLLFILTFIQIVISLNSVYSQKIGGIGRDSLGVIYFEDVQGEIIKDFSVKTIKEYKANVISLIYNLEQQIVRANIELQKYNSYISITDTMRAKTFVLFESEFNPEETEELISWEELIRSNTVDVVILAISNATLKRVWAKNRTLFSLGSFPTNKRYTLKVLKNALKK